MWLWRTPVAAVLIQPLAWETSYATGVALKSKKKKKTKNKKQKRTSPRDYLYSPQEVHRAEVLAPTAYFFSLHPTEQGQV